MFKFVMSCVVEWEVIEKYDFKKVKVLQKDNSCICCLSVEEEEIFKCVLFVCDFRIKKDRENGNSYCQERNYLLFIDFGIKFLQIILFYWLFQ